MRLSHYEMHAFFDPKAKRIDSMCVQTSSCVPEYMPALAQRAALGEYKGHQGNGIHLFENGVIKAFRVTEQECR